MQLIINVPDADVPRVQAAFGAKYGVPSANITQVKQDVSQYMQGVVLGYEQSKNVAAVPPPNPIDIA